MPKEGTGRLQYFQKEVKVVVAGAMILTVMVE